MKLLVFFLFLFPTLLLADKARLLVDNDEALRARIDLIKNAKKEICFEYFESDNDQTTLILLSLLRKKAKEGVKVKILLDDLYNGIPQEYLSSLMKEGKGNLDIRVFNKFSLFNPFAITHRSHDKLLSVDGKKAILGSRNATKEYFGKNTDASKNYRDIDVLVAGKSAEDAHDYFIDLWNNKHDVSRPSLGFHDKKYSLSHCASREKGQWECEQRVRRAQKKQKKATKEMDQIYSEFEVEDCKHEGIDTSSLKSLTEVAKIKFLGNNPHASIFDGEHQIKDQIYELIETRAKESITIVSPYFFPSKEGLKMLARMKKKNPKLKIKVITNSLKSTDNLYAQAGYHEIKDQLIEMGIELYEYHGPNIEHAKTILIDDKIAFVGSYNFDRRSESINREVGVVMEDDETHHMAKSLKVAIDAIQKDSLLVGKDGKEQNKERQKKAVGEKLKARLRSASTFLFLMRDQL